jgi:nucleoside-diphosphate-sugar epimerase
VADAIRMYLDEHFSEAVIERLRSHGVDVLTVDEAGRRSDPDIDQLRFATTDLQTMVTFDEDYLMIANSFQTNGEQFRGVIHCPASRYEYFPTRRGDDLLIVPGAVSATEMINYVLHLK